MAPVYGNGGAVDLEAAGATLAAALPAPRARIMLMGALGATASTASALALVRAHL